MMDNNGNMFNQQSPVFNAFGGFMNFQQRFNQFQQSLGQTNPNTMASYAEAQIRNGLQNGTITQQQFDQAVMIANQMLGR